MLRYMKLFMMMSVNQISTTKRMPDRIAVV